MNKTSTVRARRAEGWWVATVDEVPGLNHQTKRLDQLEGWTRSGLELFPKIEPHPETAQIRIVVEPAFEIAEEAVREPKSRKTKPLLLCAELPANSQQPISPTAI